ncbi:unnamed protein product [Rotaria sordida]|uniref:Uncharacterized protein n=1 Tax=Rotaria sordida TaxID=392033 RepID=A0A813YMR5_9BILA|nr:unnamed protein product [Rotaria sordida]CAF0896503.1 unnamed protein product [Rotaria sordida]CAF3613412.1 unnamed protein product [Rotaria sordida]CAF3666043.1 unnamed protein product [Rotaria sordida]
MASSDKTIQFSTKSNTLLDTFNAKYTIYLQSELNIPEYQWRIDEQIALLDTLKLCKITIDKFLERLKSIHEYELKKLSIRTNFT